MSKDVSVQELRVASGLSGQAVSDISDVLRQLLANKTKPETAMVG